MWTTSGRLTDESFRLRFHGLRHPSRDDLRPFVEVDYKDSLSLVAETAAGDELRIVALATYILTGDKKAEMAIVVDDPFHGKGIGSILMEHLSEAAVEAGIETFEAEVLAVNAEMLLVLRSLDLPMDNTVFFDGRGPFGVPDLSHPRGDRRLRAKGGRGIRHRGRGLPQA